MTWSAAPGVRLLLHPAPGVLTQVALQALEPEMLLLTPNHRAGYSLQLQYGHSLELTTLSSLAKVTLEACGWQLWTPAEAEGMVAALLRELPLQYLEPVSEDTGTVKVVRRFLGELHRANIKPLAFRQAASTSREHDLALIYAAYNVLAQREKRFDSGSTEYFAAAQRDLPQRQALVHGFAYLDAAQISFLQRLLPPGSLVTLPCGLQAGTARTLQARDALLSLGWEPLEASNEAMRVGDQAGLTFLAGFTPPAGLSCSDYPNIEEEVRACLRQVRTWLADGTAPEQILIIVRQESLYFETLRDVALEYEIPLRSGQRRALKHTALGQLVMRLIEAEEADWRFPEAQALFTDALQRTEFAPHACARALRLQGSPDGLAAWGAGLSWLQVPERAPWKTVLHEHLQRFFFEFDIQGSCRGDPELNSVAVAFLEALQPEFRSDGLCTREDYLQRLRQVLEDNVVPP